MDIPGNNSSTTTLDIGGVLVDSLETIGDKDWVRVELIAGESYVFTLTGTGANALFDPFLEIRSEQGVNLAQDDDAGPGLNPQLRFTAPTTGVYFLVAQSYSDENQSPTAGSYTLTADLGPPQNPLDAIDWGTKLASNIVDVFFVPSGQSAGGYESDGWTQFQIGAVMAVLETISDVANLTFNQVLSAAGAEFRLVRSSDPDLDFAGQMGPPGTSNAGVGIFNTNSSLWSNNPSPGTSGFALIMHEILHGLGFAHPHDNGGASEVLQGVIDDRDSYGVFGLNQGVYTNITYNSGFPDDAATSHAFGQQGGPSAFDIALLQQKYGANSNHNDGATIYTLTSGNQAGQFFTAIWDTGGVDSIEYAGAQNAVIDLRPATLLLGEGGGGYISRVGATAGGFTIASGVVIENASGGSGDDLLTGNDAGNVLNGNDGQDTLTGGGGGDTLNGGGGADFFLTNLTSTDFVNGGGGEDTLVIERNRGDVSSFGNEFNPSALFGFELNGAQTTIDNIELVSFLDGDIRLVLGSSSAESLVAIDAMSTLFEIGGNDDTVTGGVGDDTINGPSSGVLSGDKLIDGAAGNDLINTGDGDDTIQGGDGADEIQSRAGADSLDGGDGDDYLNPGDGDDTAVGGMGNDLIAGGVGADVLDGGMGDDTVSYSGAGSEGVSIDLSAGAGLSGIAAGDLLTSVESVLGTIFDDTMVGDAGGNFLEGSQGDDMIAGMGDADFLGGESGADTLIGGFGADTLDGGGGIDTASYADAGAGVTIFLWSQSGAGDIADGDVLMNIEEVVGGAFSDTLEGSNSGVGETLIGAGGDDVLSGLGGADLLDGGLGADTLSGGFGDDTLNGGSGDDTIGGDAGRDFIAGGDGADTLHGFGSHDSLYGGSNDDDLRGGFGRDLLSGSSGDDILRGFEGDDRLFGGGGNDTLLGNDGDDSLTGGGGVDRLKGDSGDDTLNGRFGDDSLTGGAGDDLFEFRQGHGNDTYDDFVAGAGTDDAIELIAFGTDFDTFAEIIAAASDNGNHTTIDFGGGDSILLLNVTVADLHENDFLFA